ncbi:hypothetical protein FE634_05345 [Nocardioides dongxiaopingii]|uniref:hypothetical protein n=1 Tax=Nocardioides TaxID=1839 RepID=UPI0010C765A1|nr:MULTISPECIES: hypothetical protein [Nocardioides]QCW49979.1 hypothetical protein FE634_05345 [Nocardioides sp. S-1144]
MTDRHLKDLLDSTAPDQPDLPAAARAAAVTERSRAVTRRHRALVALAAVAVVGVGVAVPLALDGDDAPSRQQVADDPAPEEPALPAPQPCPDAPVAVDQLRPGDLPDDAAWARLCPATSGVGGAADLGEEEMGAVLVGDQATALVADIEALPRLEELRPECATMLVQPSAWALVVGDGNGGTATIGASVTACGTVPVAGQDRQVEAVLALATEALAAGS